MTDLEMQGPRCRTALLAQYAPLVRQLGQQLIERRMAELDPSLELDDLIQVGWIGLLKAIGCYKELQGVPFERHATPRILGAMLDELRRRDYLPRGLRRMASRLEKTAQRLEQQLGRRPCETSIARSAGMPLEEYQRICREVHDSQAVRYEYSGRLARGESCLDKHCVDHADPLRALMSARQRQMLASAIAKIPGRERQILSHYYEGKITVREIGSIFGVSEARVCQLHRRALARVRAYCRQEPGGRA